MERFFHTLKTERAHRRAYAAGDEARRGLFGYIEGFYIPRRPHSAPGFISPAQAERISTSRCVPDEFAIEAPQLDCRLMWHIGQRAYRLFQG